MFEVEIVLILGFCRIKLENWILPPTSNVSFIEWDSHVNQFIFHILVMVSSIKKNGNLRFFWFHPDLGNIIENFDWNFYSIVEYFTWNQIWHWLIINTRIYAFWKMKYALHYLNDSLWISSSPVVEKLFDGFCQCCQLWNN